MLAAKWFGRERSRDLLPCVCCFSQAAKAGIKAKPRTTRAKRPQAKKGEPGPLICYELLLQAACGQHEAGGGITALGRLARCSLGVPLYFLA